MARSSLLKKILGAVIVAMTVTNPAYSEWLVYTGRGNRIVPTPHGKRPESRVSYTWLAMDYDFATNKIGQHRFLHRSGSRGGFETVVSRAESRTADQTMLVFQWTNLGPNAFFAIALRGVDVPILVNSQHRVFPSVLVGTETSADQTSFMSGRMRLTLVPDLTRAANKTAGDIEEVHALVARAIEAFELSLRGR